MGQEVGMFCNDGTKWESTKIEMGCGMGLLCHRGDGGTPPRNVGFNMGSSMGQHRERQSGSLRGSR